MVPVKAVKEGLITETKQLIYVPVATAETYGSVKLGDDFKLVDGKLTQKRASGSKTYTGAADSDEDIKLLLAQQDKVVLEYDLYINTINGNLYQYYQTGNDYTWIKISNVKGVPGDFKISKVYASVNEMNNGYSIDGLPVGALVVIETGNVEDEDNAKLFVKGDNNYEYLTDMSGATGVRGPQGEPGPIGPQGPTGPKGDSASVDAEMSLTSQNALQNKVITAEINAIKTSMGEINSLLDDINGEVI